MSVKTVTASLVARFAAIVGDANAITRAEEQAKYLREWRDRFTGRTAVVLRPGTTEEVSQIVALANAERVGIVPQGGNTGLVGGQIPSTRGDEIIVSLERLKRVRDRDATGGTLVVEAGVTLAEAQAAADETGDGAWMLPLSLASEGSAQIGGVLATNAGGTGALAYGSARNLCLGLEAVMADGRVWHGLKRLKKDNTGYDLRDLLIGSEGTLGIITAASLKLVARPAEIASAIAAFDSANGVRDFFEMAARGAGPALTAFEFWSKGVQDFAVAYMPGVRAANDSAHPWYVLIEISGAAGEASARLQEALDQAIQKGVVVDAVVAQSLEHQQQFWRLRESFSEAQKGAGGSIKHDVSVPVARIPEFLEKAGTIVEGIAPGARPVPFGHFGDGNVHYNVSQPAGADKAAFLKLWEPMTAAVHELAVALDGSFSAEHGVGQMKRGDLERFKSAVEIDMMRAVKKALDPNGILNPGKVL